MSDQALIPHPSLKIGIGDSARSHTADEFVLINEIEGGIDLYINLLQPIL
jgi:acetylornithine deacetylase